VDLGLDGAVAVVTGAGRGIGLAVAQTLVSEGVHVVAGARDPGPDLEVLVRAGKAHTLAVDLGTADGPGRLAELALTEFGRIDILVNNVGAVTPRTNGFLLVTDDEWTRSLTLNLVSAVRATRAVLPAMVTAGRGSIVTIASINASLPDPGVIDYSAAKAALVNFTKSVSKEFGPRSPGASPSPPRSRTSRPSSPATGWPATSPAPPSPSTAAIPPKRTDHRKALRTGPCDSDGMTDRSGPRRDLERTRDGRVQLTQRGRPLDPDAEWRGPIRIRLARGE
jgi:NAD(P)-dependent dehydrogenase (short-subunit alcohol dehydrogenase family)